MGLGPAASLGSAQGGTAGCRKWKENRSCFRYVRRCRVDGLRVHHHAYGTRIREPSCTKAHSAAGRPACSERRPTRTGASPRRRRAPCRRAAWSCCGGGPRVRGTSQHTTGEPPDGPGVESKRKRRKPARGRNLPKPTTSKEQPTGRARRKSPSASDASRIRAPSMLPLRSTTKRTSGPGGAPAAAASAATTATARSMISWKEGRWWRTCALSMRSCLSSSPFPHAARCSGERL
mmetsp:Transcript_74720/g.200158  ORF Transcript_74720/g.200158 Transcript_74720/m.200158 type:complete len:234 (-) Transcript_74720:478-1179(-)